MIGWSAFGGAVLIAVVLLGFCAYELSWKSRRLMRDVAGLRRITAQLELAQRDLLVLRTRLRDR